MALSWSEEALAVLFDVSSEPPLLVDRAPAWANDCVEAFLAPPATPWRYLEVVVDAAGGLYTARVENPGASRATWKLEPLAGAPAGLTAAVEGDGPATDRTRWSAVLTIPWEAIGVAPAPGARLAGNFFRIARGRETRHLALSPTFRTDPPEFHVPDRFVEMRLA